MISLAFSLVATRSPCFSLANARDCVPYGSAAVHQDQRCISRRASLDMPCRIPCQEKIRGHSEAPRVDAAQINTRVVSDKHKEVVLADTRRLMSSTSCAALYLASTAPLSHRQPGPQNEGRLEKSEPMPSIGHVGTHTGCRTEATGTQRGRAADRGLGNTATFDRIIRTPEEKKCPVRKRRDASRTGQSSSQTFRGCSLRPYAAWSSSTSSG